MPHPHDHSCDSLPLTTAGNRRRHGLHGLLLGLCCLTAAPAAADRAPDLDGLAAESREAAQSLGRALKGNLLSALKEGGPAHAVEACHQVAPMVAETKSRAFGWKIGRTALKVRNPANAPDPWEREVLKTFEARKARGEPLDKMEHYAIVEQNGKRVFRYMKAIPMREKPCAACHGEHIAPAVAATIDARYPEDQARGFAPGELRGAFTVVRPL